MEPIEQKLAISSSQNGKLLSNSPKLRGWILTCGGGSIKANGVYNQVKAALAGRELHEFSGIQPNPLYETLMDAVKVVKAKEDRPISFKQDVMPVFMRSGCNAGSCHGAARGKEGERHEMR